MSSVTELLAEAGNLEKKLKQLDIDVKNGEQKKSNLENDITRLQGEANRITEEIAGLSKSIKSHVAKEVVKEKAELAELRGSATSELEKLNEARAESQKIYGDLKTKVADNDKLRLNLEKAIKEADLKMIDLSNLRNKLASIERLVKEALG